MGKTGHYYHGSTVTDAQAGIGTSFNLAKAQHHVLLATPTTSNPPFMSMINGVYVRVTNIAGGSATPKITIRLCCDATGDYTALPDTEALLALGLTTNTSGVGVLQFDLPLKQFFGTSDIYLFIKIDQGTCTLAQSCITWSE